MHVYRPLATALFVTALVTTPALTVAQSFEPVGPGSAPLALQPDGALPLEGTPWRLDWYRWKGVERSPGPEVAAAMTLSGGRLEASGGCTAFRGEYGVAGSAIDIELKGLKQNDCAEQTTMVQLAMVEGLRKATRFVITAGDTGDELTMSSAAGTALLRFGLDDVSIFAGSPSPPEWVLEAYTVDGVRREPDPTATPDLVFVPEKRNAAGRRSSGTVLSSTGCNGFTGEFFLQANVISFGQLNVTDAPCPAAVLPQQEAVLAVFDATAVEIDLPADRLILTSLEGGSSLEYRADPGLEGATWILASTRGREDAMVTFRLESGRASGEGPCGPYAADYVTDGVFITFSDVRGAEVDSCTRAKEEHKLLAGLRAAVRLDRRAGARPADPRLTLRDARGAALVRFEYPFGNAP